MQSVLSILSQPIVHPRRFQSQMRIGAPVWQPSSFPCSQKSFVRTMKCAEPGMTSIILDYLVAKLKSSYTIVPYPSDVDWGKIGDANHSSTGIYRDIDEGYVDTVNVPYTIITERMHKFAFSYPLRQVKTTFLVGEREQSLQEKAKMLVTMFQAETWMATVIMLAVIFFAVRLTTSFLSKQTSQANSAADFWNIANTFTGTAEIPVANERPHILIAVITLGTFSLIIKALYQSLLFANLLPKSPTPIFGDIGQMSSFLDSGEYSLISTSPSYYAVEMAIENHESEFASVRSAILNGHIQYEANVTRLALRLTREKLIFLADTSSSGYILNDFCTLTEIPYPAAPLMWSALIFSKHNPKRRLLDEQIRLSHGIIQNFYDAANQKPGKCTNQTQVRTLPQPFSLFVLAGLFFVWAGGAATAILAFLWEISWFRFRNYSSEFDDQLASGNDAYP